MGALVNSTANAAARNGRAPSLERGSAPARRCVLLVDDDEVSLELVSALLLHDGHRVLQAADGDAAMRLLAERRPSDSPDVMLVDLQMPGLSGVDLARRARALKGPGLLLLAMSANGSRQGQLEDFDGFLLKPFALEDLRRQLLPFAKKGVVTATGEAATPSPRCPDFDPRVLRKLRTLMPEASVRALFEACLADTASRAGSMREWASRSDSRELRRAAHQIRGGASMIGASRIARLAESLEQGSGEEVDPHRLVEELLAACARLERILWSSEFCNSNDHSSNDHNASEA